MNAQDLKFEHLTVEDGLSNNFIRSIVQDSSGFMWFATEDGLNKYDGYTFTVYRHDPDVPASLSENNVGVVQVDKAGILWIGTIAGGLNAFNPQTEEFIHFNMDPDNPHGVSKEFIYDMHQDKSGGTNGFSSFSPEQIKDNPHIPEIVLTDFQIFNKSVPVRKDSLSRDDDYFLPKHISALNQIELSYNQSVFSFEFAALDYRKPQKNRYAYRMEGVDPQWVYTDATRRFATYTNLDPGEYIFRIKGSNNDGIW
jgi:hypothetical protein